MDYWQVTCSNDGSGAPTSLTLQVTDTAPVAAPLVSVQAQKDSIATNATDPADADASPSPLVALNGGAGAYDVFVDKSDTGTESYSLAAQCKTGADGTGADTGTAIAAISVGAQPVPLLPPAGAVGLVASLLALVLGFARPARAHTQLGSLGEAASATDFYQVTCSDDGAGLPQSLYLQIQDTTGAAAPLAGVQAQRAAQVTNSVDPVSGDGSGSPIAFVNGGVGVFDVLVYKLVYKTGAGATTYSLTYHCMTGTNGTGVHTGTSLAVRQNQ